MSGTIPEYDICRKRGDSHHEFFQLQIDGVGHDITGDNIDVAVNSEAAPTDTTNQLFLLTSTPAAGVVIPAGTTGLFNFGPSQAQADAANYAPGTYYYDVQWTDDPGGAAEKRTILKGKWVIEQDVTKA
jgi:hypothetical protein